MRGLELLDAGAVAVVLDDEGRLQRRAGAANADIAAAALAALEKAAAPNGATGVASANPDSPASMAAMKTLAGCLEGPERAIRLWRPARRRPWPKRGSCFSVSPITRARAFCAVVRR